MSVSIYESMVATPATGTMKGDTAWQAGGYLRFQIAANFTSGQYEQAGTLTEHFTMTCDFWAGGGTGADANFFYWGATATPTQEDSTQNQYSVDLDEFADVVELRFNGTSIKSVAYANLDDSTWRTLKISISGRYSQVSMNGVEQFTYTDSQRALGGVLFGWGGRSGGSNNEHRVRNIIVETTSYPGDIYAVQGFQ